MTPIQFLQVLSYPKSGRTWLRVMLDELKLPAHYTHLGYGHQYAKPIEELPLAIRPGFRGTVALLRDPRDTLVSGYHQATARIGKFEGTMSEFVRAPGHGLAKLMHFNLTIAGLCAGRPDCLLVTYEEMLEDAAPVLQRIVALLGGSLPADRAAAVAANNTFDRMQARERSSEYRQRYGRAFAAGGDDIAVEKLKVRRGVAGGYRDEMSAEDIAYCDALLAETGYFERLAAYLAGSAAVSVPVR